MKSVPPALAAVMLLPAYAHAAGGAPDLAATLAQTVGSLILVIGIILVLYWLAGKFMKVPQAGGSRYIRVVETRHIAPKKSLVLVEVAGEYILLSSTGDGVNFIKQVEMVEEIEVVDEHGCAALIPVQLKKKLKSLAGELTQSQASVRRLKKSGGFA